MLRHIAPADWVPIDVGFLEPQAEETVRSHQNGIVIAGPGAGKTELLAQRACYLLQTDLCRHPRRILAISFKRDAARNLEARVRQRVGIERARRFDSYTFDAFAKSVVDRFRAALPGPWTLRDDYVIDFSINDKNRPLGELLDQLVRKSLTSSEVAAIARQHFYRSHFIGKPLIALASASTTLYDRAAGALWAYLLEQEPPRVNFQMLSRLAELLLQTNPLVLSALRSTYQYVFLDEFQDTTGTQFDLTKTAFCGSAAVLTAVGDNKQRIMKWAGALDGVFEAFQKDFGAKVWRLKLNFRSAPELVHIQSVFAKALDANSVEVEAAGNAAGRTGHCRALEFSNCDQEAEFLAQIVRDAINNGVENRDICVLTRNYAEQTTTKLRDALKALGVTARVEDKWQDLLSEPITPIVLNALRVACRVTAPRAWSALVESCEMISEADNSIWALTGDRPASLVDSLRPLVKELPADVSIIGDVISHVVSSIGRSQLTLTFPSYRQGQFFDDLLKQIAEQLCELMANRSLSDALDAFEGLDSVPIMSIHKSKGLEYHTVIFVGLDDQSLFGFSGNPAEETCSFFVALSRAKQNVLFTFSRRREGLRDRSRSRVNVSTLYKLLATAGVEVEQINP